mgnify:CR=1 FL=1
MTGDDEKESGAVAAEAAIGLLLLVFLIGVVWALGRYTAAGQGVDAAASDAARAASLARSAGEAHDAAQSAAAVTLADNDVACDAPVITIDTSGFQVPAGTPATVSAQITCTVSLADLTLPVAPGSVVVTGSGVSPLDTYRERS